ncbi:MAG: hypothetical protein PVF59_11245, partial [Desulfobacterales bacterium]
MAPDAMANHHPALGLRGFPAVLGCVPIVSSFRVSPSIVTMKGGGYAGLLHRILEPRKSFRRFNRFAQIRQAQTRS